METLISSIAYILIFIILKIRHVTRAISINSCTYLALIRHRITAYKLTADFFLSMNSGILHLKHHLSSLGMRRKSFA